MTGAEEARMTDEVAEVLAGYEPEKRALAERARQIIRSIVPDAEEEAIDVWQAIAFACGSGMKIQFCSIAPYKEVLKLNFNRGGELPDPAGLLEGVAKRERFVRLEKAEDLERDTVTALIQAAADMARAEE
jgi:hypothetical protein